MTRLGVEERAALTRTLDRARGAAARDGRARLAVFRTRLAPTPRALGALAPGTEEATFRFEVPARGLALAAAGEVAVIEARGGERFARAERAARELFAERVVCDAGDAPPEAGPILVGGFAFEDSPRASARWQGFPALRFALPERLLASVDGETWLALAANVAPDADVDALVAGLEARIGARTPGAGLPPRAARFRVEADRTPEDYAAAVALALEAIAAGEVEKLVVARSCALQREHGFDVERLLRGLRAQHPACFVFALGRNGACFAGASPERLVRRRGALASACALAGSAPRGRTPEEDACLGRALCESKKEQAEHAVVRRAVCDALAAVCDALRAPEAPELLRLDGIQHLHTPVEGRLRAPVEGVLALAARLHPTPAVGGAPRAPALAWLAANEGLERGWYAGGVGWLAPNGDGELAVALRCALLRGDDATLYAGAGVVAGSTPAGELAETRLKLRALLGALIEI